MHLIYHTVQYSQLHKEEKKKMSKAISNVKEESHNKSQLNSFTH